MEDTHKLCSAVHDILASMVNDDRCETGCCLAQAMVESLLKEYPNVLVLRVRMPIVADLVYPRNFITKIIRYDKASRAVEPISPASCLVHTLLASAASITSQDTVLQHSYALWFQLRLSSALSCRS